MSDRDEPALSNKYKRQLRKSKTMAKTDCRSGSGVPCLEQPEHTQQAAAGKWNIPAWDVDQMPTLIRTRPGLTKDGKPFDFILQERVAKGEYHRECIPAEIVGTAGPLVVSRIFRTFV